MTEVLRIANCSGFYGDRLSAAREMVDGGPIDVLTGDYLAELTMALLWRSKVKDPDGGYAATYLAQMEDVLGSCLEAGVKVVTNAGGLNPRGLALRLSEAASRQSLAPVIGVIDGDDLIGDLPTLLEAGVRLTNMDTGHDLVEAAVQPITANAYLGGWGIAKALTLGADVVVTGRVTDAALVIGPSASHFGWERDAWDQLAGALVAGHVIECGAQATGGNYSFLHEVPDIDRVGFPLVEMEPDGSFTVTKHPNTGGLVSIGTVTAQLLYEIGGIRYLNPDVTARFDSIRLTSDGPDRVRVAGVRGEPPPPTTKVAINYLGGYRNSMTFVLTGLDIEAKSAALQTGLWRSLGGIEQFASAEANLIRTDVPDADSNEQAMAQMTVTVKDPDPARVGRAFSRAGIELALSSYPGFFVTSPPGDASPYAVYWPALVPSSLVEHRVTVGEHSETIPSVVSDPIEVEIDPAPPAAEIPSAEVLAPLGFWAGARSGDKGGNANVGFWVESAEAYAWLREVLDSARFRQLLPEAADLAVERHEFPNLNSLNFVVKGLLGEGVSSSTRFDAQAKSLGEYMRSRLIVGPSIHLRNQPSGPSI